MRQRRSQDDRMFNKAALGLSRSPKRRKQLYLNIEIISVSDHIIS